MHIETLGSGPSLVLLHGWALHGGVFAPLVQRLSDRYTLHLVDLPGHGFSRDSEVPLTLDATVTAILARTPPAAWLAWSLGGLFALQAAASSPRVRGLAMVAATPRFVRDGDWAHAVEGRVFAQFGDDLRNDYAGTLERFLALDTMGSEHARSELRTLREALVERGDARLPLLRDPDVSYYMRQERHGLILGPYEWKATPMWLDGMPDDFANQLWNDDFERLEKYIEDAMARVPATAGDTAEVDIRGKMVAVKVVKPAFVRMGKKVI